MNFSEPWVSHSLLSLFSLSSFPSITSATSLHEVDYPSCPLQKKAFLVPWEWHAWLPTTSYCSEKLPGKGGRDLQGDAAEGKSLSFTGDMKHWMLNSSLNRRGIVTRNMKRGGGHNIIHVKHLSRACISNARGGLWSPVLFSCVLSFFILFHPSQS